MARSMLVCDRMECIRRQSDYDCGLFSSHQSPPGLAHDSCAPFESTLSITSKAQIKAFTQEHVRKVHRYNDLRDMEQVLGGRLADLRSVPLRNVFEELGVDRHLWLIKRSGSTALRVL